jgi:hypothetical protein
MSIECGRWPKRHIAQRMQFIDLPVSTVSLHVLRSLCLSGLGFGMCGLVLVSNIVFVADRIAMHTCERRCT